VSNPNATILFVGFSTEGSLASLLKDPKRKSIIIDEKEYKCRCSSYSLKSMSGHMPFHQLIEYYSSINTPKIILHHGSKEAKNTLASALKQELEKKCKTTRVVIANSSLKFTL
jgi:predicted metal-dependent RNase